MWVKLTWKTCLLVTSEILGLSFNPLTADDKYSSYKRQNFPQAIQMVSFERTKISYQFFIAFLESTSNLENFE